MPPQLRRILIVEDDAITADHYARILRLEGYDVLTALSAADGLRHVETEAPDAILVDFRMPIMDGVAYLRQLRTRSTTSSTPVAIVTGDYLLDDFVIAEMRALGARVRFKPLWMDDVSDLVRELLTVAS